MAELHCVGDDLTLGLGVSIHKFETPVGIHGRAWHENPKSVGLQVWHG